MAEEIKVGTRLCLSTGVEAEVTDVGSDGEFNIELPRYIMCSQELKELGITWEVIKPQLPEPPVGSVIRFVSAGMFRQSAMRREVFWQIVGSNEDWTWTEILDYSASGIFELLRPEKEVVKEVLHRVITRGNDWDKDSAKKTAEEYGVEL